MSIFALVLAVTGLSFLPRLGLADGIKPGTYTNGKNLTARVLTAVVDGQNVALSVGTENCIGELRGRLAQNTTGDWFILGIEKPRCVLSLTPQGTSSFSLKQHENCSNYHGASCSFEGFLSLTN